MIYSQDSLQYIKASLYQAICDSSFNPYTDTIKYLQRKIYISFLRNAAGCANYKGNIDIREDTIKLLLENLSEEVCSEENCWRLIYEIENNGNKRYVIKKY